MTKRKKKKFFHDNELSIKLYTRIKKVFFFFINGERITDIRKIPVSKKKRINPTLKDQKNFDGRA